jgi:hypothetical protein
VHNAIAWIYWKTIIEDHFIEDGVFQLSLISARSGSTKHFSLPIYLIPRLFQSCLDIGDSSLSHDTQLKFSAPDPHSSNIQWSISCNNFLLAEIEGKVTLDYVFVKDHIENKTQSKFKRFHFVAHSVAFYLFSNIGNSSSQENNPSIAAKQIMDGEQFLTKQPTEEMAKKLVRILEQNFNEYGITKKAMRIMEMYDIWQEMSKVIDLSFKKS